MECSKLYQFFISGKFSDVDLILDDGDITTKLSVHRVILASASDDYLKLFSEQKTEFTINVKNTAEAHDQIISFYHPKTINFSLYPDIKLTLRDKDNSIEIYAHRVILASASEYFLKMFIFGDNYHQSNFSIQVDDTAVAHDLIMSFYGQNMKSNWMHHLKMIKCKSFFCIDLDPKDLYDFKVPPEGFELLLEVMDLFDYTNNWRLMVTISRNIPKDYDLSNFTTEFVKELTEFRNRKMVSTSCDKTIKLWDINSGQCLRTFEGHTGWVYCAALFADNTRMISGGSGNELKLWDVETGQCLRIFELKSIGSRGVLSVALFTDNVRMISVHANGTITLWNIETGQVLRVFKGHTNWVRSVALFSDNTKMVSASDDKTIKLWDIETGQCLYTFEGHTDWVRVIALFSDNTKMVSGSDDGTIRLWNIETGQCLRIFKGHVVRITSLKLFPDNSKMISGGYGGTIKIWDLGSEIETDQCLSTHKMHTSYDIAIVSLMTDIKIIIDGCYNKIKLWDIETGECLRVLEGHSESILSIAIFTSNTK